MARLVEETSCEDSGASRQSGPFQQLRARSLLLWIGAGVLFGVCLNILVASLGLEGFRGRVVSAAVWYTSILVAPILWIALQSSLSCDDLRFLFRLPSKGFKWYHLFGYPVLATSLNWGCQMIEASLLRSLFRLRVSAESVSARILGPSLESRPGPIVCVVLFLIAVVIIIGPLIEELVFRGLLLNRWAIKWSTPYAILISSALFAGYHWPRSISAFIFGLLMALLYVRTRTLLVPIVCHAFSNALHVGITCLLYLPPLRSQIAHGNLRFVNEATSLLLVGTLCLSFSLPWFVQLFHKQLRDPTVVATYLHV